MRNLILLLCCASLTLSAQDFSKIGTLQDLQKKASKTPMQLPDPPGIEHAVDEASYVVGPGDVFSIIIGGQAEEEQQAMVTPEGELVFPAVGAIDVSGLVLSEAKQAIKNQLSEKYVSNNISISLIRLRTFRVTVSGAVNYPGLVPVNAVDRVSDAIFMAGGLIEPPPPFPEPEDPRKQNPSARKLKIEQELSEEEYEELKNSVASKRHIVVKRRDGSLLKADLLKYQLSGDVEANPYLLDGDVIVVETRQKDVGEISISGAVKRPRTLEFTSGDCIDDLIEMAHGFRVDADSSKLFLARFEADGYTIKTIEYDMNWENTVQVQQILQTPLHPDDRLFVRQIPKYHTKRMVKVEGEVRYPGEYPLTHNPTMLSEIIELSGGFTKQAMLNASHVIRKSYEDIQDREYERLDLMLVNEMERKEKAYYREMAREIKGLVSTDFPALFVEGNKDFDIPLRNSDIIVVPAKDYSVNVVGHVKRPGLVEYLPQHDFKHYIQLAGGYNNGAWKSKIRVRKAGTGELIPAQNAEIEMGDTIFVPERVERDMWELFRDVALVTSQFATVIMMVVQINYWSNRD